MPKQTRLAEATLNAQADALAQQLDDGYVRLYAGVQPASADDPIDPTAPANHVLLATLRLANPSAMPADNGVLTFEIPAEAEATGQGTASWFRLLRADGTTPVLDGSIGLAADTPNMVISGTSVVPGTFIRILAISHTLPASTPGY